PERARAARPDLQEPGLTRRGGRGGDAAPARRRRPDRHGRPGLQRPAGPASGRRRRPCRKAGGGPDAFRPARVPRPPPVTVRLYNSQLSGNCWKVRQLLALRGIEYERVDLDVIDRSNRREVLGGKNPALRVPTLELDDGEFLAESNAILWYLADGTPYLPADPLDRARILQWMFFEQYEVEPNLAVARFWIAILGDRDRYAEELEG